MRNYLIAMLLAGCGGGPMLRNAPRVNPSYVAGGAAAVAGALTLADPDAAAARAEEDSWGCVPIPPPKNVSRIVPESAFDELDIGGPATVVHGPIEDE
jgi:hypothetical protein